MNNLTLIDIKDHKNDSNHGVIQKQILFDSNSLSQSPFIIHNQVESNLRRHPTAVTRSNMDVYNRSSDGREIDKSFVLPNIIKSVDNVHQQMDSKDEYKDRSILEDLKVVKSQTSLRSCNIGTRSDSKTMNSKSLCTRKMSKSNKQEANVKTIENDDSINN